MGWIRTSLFLCIFGFLKEFKPSEPIVVEYLTGPWKNFTEIEVYQQIFPVGTYCYVATLFPVLLLTDFLRYKPIIIICGLAGSCVYIGQIMARTIQEMNFVQFSYGVQCSTEVAYFAYIYAKVDKEHFQAVTSHSRAALQLGRFVSSVMSQLAITFNLLNYQQLNYASLTDTDDQTYPLIGLLYFIQGLVLATIWSFFLPSVGQSVYFHRARNPISNGQKSLSHLQIATIELQLSASRLHDSQEEVHIKSHSKEPSLTMRIINAYHLLWKDFLLAYSNCYVLKWSIWWIFTTCGYTQVYNYMQSLWQDSLGGANNYNAAIEGANTILGALVTFAVGKLKLNWSTIEYVVLSTLAILQGIMLFMAAKTYNIWLAYALYIGFNFIYQGMITLTSAEVAKNISEDSHGLIFGMNTLMALLMQSALTIAVSGSQGFALNIRAQYVVYGGYFVALGAAFMVMAIHMKVKHCRNNKQLT